uniref:Uncharacterized protein n=1 Tax=Callorhinchus milii TaxID=7868 RepID=A0A4W3GIM6_CALMI
RKVFGRGGQTNGKINKCCSVRCNLLAFLLGAFCNNYPNQHSNLVVNLGLFAVGIWIARNLSDIDLMAPQPLQ